MKKFFTALLGLSMTLMLLLSGCHGSQKKTVFEVPESFDENTPVTITFWAKNDTNKNQTDVYKKAIADFEKIYPNIKVNLKLYTDYGKIYNDIITNIATDTTPNVAITYPDHIASYLQGANTVVALDELMNDPANGLGGSDLKFDGPTKDEIVPAFLEEGIIGENQYALPFMRSTEALYINKTLVEKLGYEIPDVVTWDWIWEVSEKATEKNDDGTYVVNNQKVLIPFIYKSTDNMMIQVLRQKNAGYSEKNGAVRIFNNTTRDFLYEISAHVKSGAFSTFKISSYPANFLNAGQCIFAIDSTAGSTWMGSDAPLLDISEDAIVKFETEVLPIPQYNPEKPQMISQGPSICIFNKEDPQEVLASWLFTQYLLTNDVQIAYSQTEGYVPVTEKAQKSAEYQDYLSRSGEDNSKYYDVKIKATQLLLSHTGDTFTTNVFNGSASLRDASGQLIENVAKSTRRKQTIDDAYMDKLYTDVIALYRLNLEGEETDGRQEFGKLPGTAVALLAALGGTWALILVYLAYTYIKKKQKIS